MSRKMQAVDTGERNKIAKLKNEIKSDSNTKVEWIYSGDKIDRDAYLLGKPIDKMLMEKESEKPKEEIMVSTVDLANKIRDDPLFEIKKREIEAKKRLLENPLRLKQLQQMLSANSRSGAGGGDQESSSSSSSDSEDERRKKKHKKKHKKEHKKKKTSREESRDRSKDRSKRHRSKSRSRSRSRSPQRQRKDDAYGLKKASSSSAKDETSHRKDDGKRSDKAREIDEYKEKIKKLKEMQKSSGSSSVAQPSKKLSDEEKRRRLEEMQANAKWRDQVRSSNVSKMEQDEKREKRLEEASKSSRLQTEASNMFKSDEKSSINQVGYKRKLSSGYIPTSLNNNGNANNTNNNNNSSTNQSGEYKNGVINGGVSKSSSGVVGDSSSNIKPANGHDRKNSSSALSQQRIVSNGDVVLRNGGHGGANLTPATGATTSLHSNHLISTAPNGTATTSSETRSDDANLSIPHIADFYPEEVTSAVPADNPRISTLFLPKANIDKRKKMNESTSFNTVSYESSTMNGGMSVGIGGGAGGSINGTTKKSNSCSTIYIDDSTVSQPNLKTAIRLVACAIHYHIKRRTGDRSLEIFDERLYPLSRDSAPIHDDYRIIVPDHRVIYKFMKNLFTAAQLTAECAIVTLIYLERVLTYAEIDLCPANWKRLLLGAILLASKVWDDQAVWNVDYCQILKDINVENMNELERQYLNLLQFNINVPSSVYAKYYFDLRTLAEDNNLAFAHELLTREKACKLEAMSSACQQRFKDMVDMQMRHMRRTASVDNLFSPSRKSLVILS